MNKCALVLLIAGLAGAQTKPPERAGPSRIIYEFKNVDVERVAEIVNFVGLLDSRVSIQFNGPFKTAIIQPNGVDNVPQDVLEKAERLLVRYDVAPPPPPKIEFVAYLVRASTRNGESAPHGQPIPAALQDAIAEMKSTFAYVEYTLLDTVATEVRHHLSIENLVAGAQAGPSGAPAPFFYQIAYGDTVLSADGKTVIVNPFKFSLRVPDWPESIGITTDVTIHEGQKLVLGKVRTSITDPVDVFLVLTVKLH